MITTTKTTFLVPDGVYVGKVDEAKEGVSPGKGTPFIELVLALVEAGPENESQLGKRLKFISMYFTEANSTRVEKFLHAFYPEKIFDEGDELGADAQDLLGERVCIVVGHETYEKKDGTTATKNVVKEWLPEDEFEAALAHSASPLSED